MTLIIAQSKQQAYSAVSDTVRVLRDLGFVVHPQKSVLEPVQEITYLGCVLNSILMTSQLTVDRQHEIRDLGQKLLGRQDLPIYEVATFVGKIVAAFPGAQYGKLHYRALEKDKSCALMLYKGNYQTRMNLSEDAKVEIRWWILNITQCTRTLLERTPSLRLQTDASGLGWGASDGTTHIGGKWNESEQLRANINQINYLELLVVFHALKAFCCELSNAHVVVQVDNTTAVAYINDMGGSKSKDCNLLAKHLWGWCISRDMQVTAIHIPGASNKVADYKSRHFKVETEWKLDRKVFDGLCSRFGVPEIDLFASRLNAQLDRFVSWAPDPDAESVDAFCLNWRFFAFYAFPPFCLISRCLKKIRTDKATGLMIVPYWSTQHWFPRLVDMLIEFPLILPKSKRLLSQPTLGELHPLCNKLYLVCCRLSGNSTKIEDFHQKFVKFSSSLGGDRHLSSTSQACRDGFVFVHNGQRIPFERMSV